MAERECAGICAADLKAVFAIYESVSSNLHTSGESEHDTLTEFRQTMRGIMIDLKTRLSNAAVTGDTRLLESLLEKGVDVDVHANDDEALRMAARYGHTDTVRLLLEKGADVHANNDEASRFAAALGHTDTTNLLKEWIATHPDAPAGAREVPSPKGWSQFVVGYNAPAHSYTQEIVEPPSPTSRSK